MQDFVHQQYEPETATAKAPGATFGQLPRGLGFGGGR